MSGNKEFKKQKLFELHALNGGNAAIFSSIDMEDNNSHSDTDISDEDEKIKQIYREYMATQNQRMFLRLAKVTSTQAQSWQDNNINCKNCILCGFGQTP